jgi:hypothetical protein
MIDFILLTPTLSATARHSLQAVLYHLHPCRRPASPKAPTVGALLPASSRRGSARIIQPIVFIPLKTCVDTYASGEGL